MKSVRGALAAAVTLVLALGCSRERDQITSTTTTTSARFRVSNQEAIAHLMEASCSREKECFSTGESLPQGVRDDCLAEAGQQLRASLGPSACPQGVDGAQLDACLTELKTEACHLRRPAAERSLACKTVALCPPAPPP